MALKTSLRVEFKAVQTKPCGLGPDGSKINRVIESLTRNDGTNPDQADVPYSATVSLAGAPVDIDLNGSLQDCFGDNADFLSVSDFIVLNTSETTGENVTVGGDATAPWFGFLADASDANVIPPSGFLLWSGGDVDAIAVTPTTGDILQLDPGAATFDVELVIIGRSA